MNKKEKDECLREIKMRGVYLAGEEANKNFKQVKEEISKEEKELRELEEVHTDIILMAMKALVPNKVSGKYASRVIYELSNYRDLYDDSVDAVVLRGEVVSDWDSIDRFFDFRAGDWYLVDDVELMIRVRESDNATTNISRVLAPDSRIRIRKVWK